MQNDYIMKIKTDKSTVEVPVDKVQFIERLKMQPGKNQTKIKFEISGRILAIETYPELQKEIEKWRDFQSYRLYYTADLTKEEF